MLLASLLIKLLFILDKEKKLVSRYCLRCLISKINDVSRNDFEVRTLLYESEHCNNRNTSQCWRLHLRESR